MARKDRKATEAGCESRDTWPVRRARDQPPSGAAPTPRARELRNDRSHARRTKVPPWAVLVSEEELDQEPTADVVIVMTRWLRQRR